MSSAQALTAACREVVQTSAPDKSRFRFQKLLQPFTLQRSVLPPSSGSCWTGWCFGAAIASLLMVESWWIRVFASLVAALWIARLFVIGHDACHGSYTPSKMLNGGSAESPFFHR